MTATEPTYLVTNTIRTPPAGRLSERPIHPLRYIGLTDRAEYRSAFTRF